MTANENVPVNTSHGTRHDLNFYYLSLLKTNFMGRLVIVAYKPKPGKDSVLHELTRNHYPILKQLDLVTSRAPAIMTAKDGTVIEVFEWASAEAIQQAHKHPEVLKMWAAYAEACDYIPLNQLEESANMFADFTPF